MIVADSHEFLELYRGDKDLRMGIEMTALREDLHFVSFAPDRPSPNDRDVFGISRTSEGPLPELPDRVELRLLPSVAFRFAGKEMGGIASMMPTIGLEIRRLRPQVVMENPFSWLTPRSYQTSRAAAALGIPMVYYDPGDDVPISLKQRALVPLERPVVNRAARIITFNAAGRRRFVNKYGYPGERIHVIPKPVDVAACRWRGDVPAARAELGIAGHHLVVGYIGRLAKAKGSATLLEVARRFTSRPSSPAHFLFIGGTLASSERQDEYQGENVTVTGMVPHDAVAKYIACCDIVVFPDVASPGAFPTAVAEAMAAGKALVVGTGPHTEFVPLVHGETALLVEPSSPDAIEVALLQLANQPQLAQRLGEAVGRFTAEEMDYPVVARRYLEILDEVAGG